MRLFILSLICISFMLPAAARRSFRFRHGYGSSDYSLSNRVFLKWTPTALIRLPESVFRVGAEYCFAKRFGLELQGGPLFGGRRQSANASKATGGWEVRAEPRIYFGASRVGRWVSGIQGLYRQQNFDGGYTSALNKYADIINFSQDGAHMTAIGGGAYIGYMFRLGDGLHLEFSTGLGTKSVQVTRDNLQGASYPQGTAAMFISEDEVYDRADLPYLIFQLKFAGLLGGDR